MKVNNRILDVYFVPNNNYEVRNETFDGKEYLVVPVTMMVEGVHSGSHGPILHYAEDLGRYPESWNGIPVTIGHPKVDGVYVSATSPDVLTDWAVGRIFNTYIEDDALKAEAWLSIEDLERVSEDTLERIKNNEIIEVSVGIFSDEEETQGTYNNEQYIAIARNHRPNHLALLPDEVGACSIEDGCGVRVNKKGGTNVKKNLTIVTNENREQVLRELNRNGFSVNEMGQFRKADEIREAVYSLDRENKSYYVEEIFDEYVIYMEYDYSVNPRMRKLYQQSYTENAAGQIELTGEAVQVKKDISYVVVEQVTVNNHKKVERNIQKNKSMCTECVKNLVDKLIANKATAYSEEHRDQLEAMPEEILEIMSQNQTPQVNKTEDKKIERADILAVLSESPLTEEEYLNSVAPEVREKFEEGVKIHKEQKETAVKSILDNTDAWTEDELNGKSLKELLKINKAFEKEEEIEHVSAGGLNSNSQGTQKGVVMLPPNVQLDKE